MSITSKTQTIARRGLKVQRRIAITEALFWPVLLGTGVVIALAVLLTRRLGHRPASPATNGTAGTTPVMGPADSTAGLAPVTE